MKKSKKTLIVFLSIFLIFSLTIGTSAAKYIMKVAHGSPDVIPMHRALQFMEKKIEEESNGKIDVQLYPNGQLGYDREQMEGMQMGTIEMALPSTANMAGFGLKKLLVMDLPFIFNHDRQVVYKALDGPIGQEILASFAEKGIVGLGYFENGYRHITNSKRPVRVPGDLKGLKIRNMPNDLQLDTFNNYGAMATPMSFGDVFTSLQNGTIDGQENPAALNYTMHFNEVQKYMTRTGHFYSSYVVCISKMWWDGLPEDIRNIISNAVNDAVFYQRVESFRDDLYYTQFMRGQEGFEVIDLSPEELVIWREASKPIYKKYKDEIGEKLIKEFQKANKTEFDF